jgi:hypothetical protein
VKQHARCVAYGAACAGAQTHRDCIIWIPALHDHAQRAAGILGRMHGGAESTYRSYTIRRQIEDAGKVQAINAERQLRGMPPLA